MGDHREQGYKQSKPLIMFLSNQRKEKKEVVPNIIVMKMGEKLNALTAKFAAYLQHKTNLLNEKTRWFLFVVFVIGTTSLSCFIIYKTITEPAIQGGPTTGIKKPGYILNQGTKLLSSKMISYRTVLDLERMIDSLEKKGNRRFLDSLLYSNPGLADTLKILESIFKKQTKETLWKRKQLPPNY